MLSLSVGKATFRGGFFVCRTNSSRTETAIPELDGLRGAAIALVIAFHLVLILPGIPPALARFMLFGWSGVDLFFVLSGFLIGGILIDHRDAAAYYKPFYARRFFRIIPIYFVILSCYAACWVLGGDIRRTLVGNVGPPMPWYAYLSFTNNLWLAMHNTMDVFLPITWSLAVEEQFYLTLPLIVRYVSPKNLPKVIFSITGLVMMLRVVSCFSGHVHQNQAYVLPWFRSDSLMIGVMCAIAIRDDRVKRFLDKNVWVLYTALAIFGSATSTSLMSRGRSMTIDFPTPSERKRAFICPSATIGPPTR